MAEVVEFADSSWLPYPIEDDVLSQDKNDSIAQLLAEDRNQSKSQQEKGWEAVGMRKPFISSTSVGVKVVQFDVTTTLCPGVTESFAVTFEPGIPSRIFLLGLPSGEDQEQMVVQNGESLQTLTVACFDSFNNRTDPNKVLLADGDEGWTPRRDTLCL